MDKIDGLLPWYKSAIIRQQIVVFIASVMSLLGLTTDIDVDATVAAIFAGVGALVSIWTIVTRATKATPPITQTGAQQEQKIVEEKVAAATSGIYKMPKQTGIIHPLLAASLAALASLLVASNLAGCAGTSAAYRAAEGVEQQAYVALEHYDALLQESVKLKANPNVPREVVTQIQAVDAKLHPVIQRVKAARDLYRTAQDAPNQAALQQAVNEAVLLLADLIDAVKKARGTP